jgi:hypothetical protein
MAAVHKKPAVTRRRPKIFTLRRADFKMCLMPRMGMTTQSGRLFSSRDFNNVFRSVKVSILLRSDNQGPTEQKVDLIDLADERFVLRRDALNAPATFQVEKKPAEQANGKIQKNERNNRAPLKTINPDL